MKIEFSRHIFEKKNAQISNLVKIRLVGAELFRADWYTDRHEEANSRFSEFCESAQIFTGLFIDTHLQTLCNIHRAISSFIAQFKVNSVQLKHNSVLRNIWENPRTAMNSRNASVLFCDGITTVGGAGMSLSLVASRRARRPIKALSTRMSRFKPSPCHLL